MEEQTKSPTELLVEKFQAHLDDILRTRHTYSVLTLDIAELTLLVELLASLAEEA